MATMGGKAGGGFPAGRSRELLAFPLV